MAKRQITGVLFDIWFPDPYFLKRYVLHELIQKSERALTEGICAGISWSPETRCTLY